MVILVTMALLCSHASSWADDPAKTWNKDGAAKYLDERGKSWFAFTGADRGEGATKSSCVSCHTLLPFALGRPALRKVTGVAQPTEYETKLLAQVRARVDYWKELDTPKFGLFYDFSEPKKTQSWGTEAVLNALILAWDDAYQGHKRPSDSTQRAFANLWQTQVAEGDQKGSWEWLNFGLEPWESNGGRYLGAALAAIAIGTAPGYRAPGAESKIDKNVDLLRGYLKRNLEKQNLHNRAWLLWASKRLDGLLTAKEQKLLAEELLAKRQADGGWRLSSLGDFVRGDGTPQDTPSDGYATGLVLTALQIAGLTKDDPRIARGLVWLGENQSATGQWRTNSVNKKRDPESHSGKFMSDAATAYAILALSQP
jgi:squalene-hopene/tetraprenyl-beta-curcumene cyclase